MTRIGGDVVVETLRALGADTVFGLPGQHALGLFEALRRADDLRVISGRVENNLAFAADGFARARLAADPDGPVPVTPLVVSTGPGALLTLASLQESRAASVPVLGISSQVPVAGLGGGRHGYLHELPDQQASFRDVVKSVHVVRRASQIPTALREAWTSAATAPYGPVWVEIPQDVLLGPPGIPPITSVAATPPLLEPLPELVTAAAELLAAASNPVILAGGGALRSGAHAELTALAEALRAPVISTFGGKGVFGWDHELSGRSWLEDWHTTEFLADADLLLVLGSGLGELSSNYREFAPRGRVIQVEADLGKLESNYPGLGIHADVRLTLQALLEQVPMRSSDGRAETAVSGLLSRVESRLAGQDLAVERKLIDDLRGALPKGTQTYLGHDDRRVLGLVGVEPRGRADPHRARRGRPGLRPAGRARRPRPAGGATLAVSGDGGAMYGVAELATAVQHRLDVTWLVVDDGGYGVLREYLTGTFGHTTATELTRPDFVALASSFGVRACLSSLDTVGADVAEALCTPGPSVVVLPALLKLFAPTHLEQALTRTRVRAT